MQAEVEEGNIKILTKADLSSYEETFSDIESSEPQNIEFCLDNFYVVAIHLKEGKVTS